MKNRIETFDRDVIENTVFSRAELSDWMRRLWASTERERMNIVGLPPEKADVILMGVAIHQQILDSIPCDELHITMRGLRYGALLGKG